ncbi:MAG: hypothetical protein IKQ33_01680 [Clostridia bacterium]|nr:hypothetical protein [Clostridia bacterium]
MKDYEQLYYDALHEIKQLKKRIEELEADLRLVNSSDLKKLDLKKEIMKELKNYKENKSEKIRRNKTN